MRARLPIAVLVLASVTAVGCGTRETPVVRTAPQAARPAAKADSVDMCAEHGVLEAICTKCRPNLIPVFQAKGDWCADHGFPMSVCPVHHPERGGRPAVAIAPDEAPATGTKVRFLSPQTARDAGLETAQAVAAEDDAGILATATLVADASRVAVVNPRAAGVVESMRVDVGSRVARGDPLAVLESSAVGEDRSRLAAARSRASVAEAAYERARELHDRGLSAVKELQEAKQEWDAAKAEVDAASAALGMVGTSGGLAGAYTLRAPISGVVTRRAATVGTLVDTDDALFEIVDTSWLWAEIDVPEAAAVEIRPGQRVALRVEGLSDREFAATLRFVSPVIDPQTRTVRARAHIDNRDGRLKANMYARARILREDPGPGVLVPQAAVQEAKGVPIVFVQLAPDLYEVRRVRTGPAGEHMAVIRSGVRPTESVVTTGSFLLKTETLKESLGAGCCEVVAPAP